MLTKLRLKIQIMVMRDQHSCNLVTKPPSLMLLRVYCLT